MYPLVKRLSAAFFEESMAATTLIMTAGLIATVVYATSCPPTGAIIVCAAIGLIGVVTMCFQVRNAYRKLREEEEAFGHSRTRFLRAADSEKESLQRLLTEGSVAQDELPNHNALLATGFVWRDGTAGRFLFLPGCSQHVARLVKEWRSGKLK
jgi:hypothetical protein